MWLAMRERRIGRRSPRRRRPLGLLHLGPLVLKPDLDLVLRQSQLLGQPLPPRLCEVAARAELALQPLNLLAVEGRARPLAPFPSPRRLLFRFLAPGSPSAPPT